MAGDSFALPSSHLRDPILSPPHMADESLRTIHAIDIRLWKREDKGAGVTAMIRFALTGQLFLIGACVLPLAAGKSLGRAVPPAEIVRDDWYLRESLAAIRDWESLLARLEKEPAGGQIAPSLPVPFDGRPVTWPNPVPRMLLPVEDRDKRLRVRWFEDRLQVQRIDGGVEEPW